MDDAVAATSAHLNELGFVQAKRPISFHATGTPGAKGATQRAATYDDFTIDGKRLYELLFPDHKPDNITSFDASWPEGGIVAADELLGVRNPELDDGRIPLYVCPECFDLGCGALTVDIERNDNVVTWKNFGWQTDYEEGWDAGDYTELKSFAPLVFARTQYELILNEQRKRFAAIPPPESLASQPPSKREQLIFRLLRRFVL